MGREEQAAAWAQIYATRSIAARVNLSTIERSPPPETWTLRSPRLSRRVEDGSRATGPFELL